MSKINKLITLATIFILLVSNLGNSLQVIAETTKPSDTKPYEETSFVSEKTEENLIVESDQPKESEETENKKNESNIEDDAESQTEDNSMSSIEAISGVNRYSYAESWEIGEGVDSYGLREWVSGNLKSYIDSALRGKTLGGNVGDKIEGIISFPSQMKIEGLTASNWNNQNTIILGGENGYYYFKNIRFSHDESIKISLSGTDTDSSRKIVIERVAVSTKSIMSIGVEYSFTSKGTVSANVGVKQINPGGVGNSIQFTINANPSTSVSFNDLTSVEQDNIKKRMASVIGTQVWRNNIFRGSRNDLPTSLPSLGWEIGDFYVLDMGKTFNDISIDDGLTIGGHISIINEPEVEYKLSAKGFMKHSYVDGQFRLERTKKGFINTQVVDWKNVKIESSDLLYVNTQFEKILVRLDEPIVLDTVNGYSGARGPEKFEVDVNNDLSINVGEKLDEEFIRENILKSAKLDNKEIPLEDVEIQSSSIDTSEPGKKTLTVTFKENNSKFVGGTWNKLEVEKNINVDINYRVITADAVETSIPLGTDTSKLQPKDFVTNVKLSETPLDETEYTVENLSGLTSSVVSSENLQYKISLNSNPAITTTIDVPVSVVWGNTIGSNNVVYSSSTGFSLSLLTEDKPNLVATLGNGLNSKEWINDYKNGTYISTKLYKNSQVLNSESAIPYINLDINGHESAISAMNKWNNLSNKNEIFYGDVLQYDVLTTWGDNNWVMRNETQKFESLGKQSVYYEITKEGFRTLHLNHLKNDKNFKIYVSDTKETLETKLKNNEFLTNEGYSSVEIVEFSGYPDTSKAGNTTGKIKVKEKLSTNQYVYYDYEVKFEVEDDRVITAEAVETSIPLGTDTSKLQPKDFVTNVKLSGKPLDETKYTVEKLSGLTSSVVSSENLQYKISLNSNPAITTTIDVPVSVVWGNSIHLKGAYSSAVSTLSLVLGTDGKSYMIKGVRGKNYNGTTSQSVVHTGFNDKYIGIDYLEVNSQIENGSNMTSYYDTEIKGSDTLTTAWQKVYLSKGVKVGNVVKIEHQEFMSYPGQVVLYNDSVDSQPNKDKKMVNNTGYFEITENGFKQLNFNQLKNNKKFKIYMSDTKETLETKLKNNEFLTNEGYSSIEIVEFSTLPDISKAGDTTGKIKVKEKLSTNQYVYYEYEVEFEVEDDRLIVETKELDILLGTNISLLSPESFIDSVKLGNQELTTNDYKVEYVAEFDTSITGNPQVSLKITLNSDSNKFVEVNSKANVKYGSTIISKANYTEDVDVSVSLLDNKGVPYLNANQGFGFQVSELLLSRPNMSIYRDSTYKQILSVNYGTVKNKRKDLAKTWNESFDKVDLEYGDVVKYSVNDYGISEKNSEGKNTWISRNESLVLETKDYNEAYYELTTSGYRLMNINQLEVNNSNKVSLNTSKEEMDKNILSYINIPSHISNPQDYRMEFQSVDTSSSGKKTSTIEVYQRLQSGGEFMTTYTVNYTVNPEIEETSYDVEGKEIVETKKTSFDYGTQFKPSPTKYLEKDDNLYVYKGWLENTEEPGVDVPKEGIPSPTEKESKFYYIYEKADKYINVTIPTEMVFGTFDNTEEVKSNKYEIKNNSKELTTSVTLDSFQSVSTSVKLLGENDEPDEKIDSARLNLLINDEPKIKGFNETKFDIELANIEPENKITIGINGEYYDKTSKTNIVEYNTTLKFKAISGN
ncbi:TPA: bacterial Ig-like domain-containing protein [Listeria monocytogenes]|nr:bacterial Ig-like domain-containing protein [Listeria monocytogenes]HBJ9024770.1 bacterial Ig-like domain-containing protein [Listeria monocytogenes]